MSGFDNRAFRISSDGQSPLSPEQVAQLYGPNATVPASEHPVQDSIPTLYPSTPASEFAQSTVEPYAVAQLYRNVVPSVVQIETPMYSGSGFIVSSNGDVITDNHVLEQSGGRVQVTTSDGSTYNATIVKQNQSKDLALLHIQSNGQYFQPVQIASDTNLPKVGSEVVAVGHPRGWPETFLSPGAFNGTTTDATNTSAYNMDPNKLFLDATLHTEPGNSGSPVFNMQGQVVGVVDLGGPLNTKPSVYDTESTSARDLRAFLGEPVSPLPDNTSNGNSNLGWLGLSNIGLLTATPMLGRASGGILPMFNAFAAGSMFSKDWKYLSTHWGEANTGGKFTLAEHVAADALWFGGSIASLFPQYRRIGAAVGLGTSLWRALG